MINFNGNIVSQEENSLNQNRAFLYGDGVFETVKVLNGKVLFIEDHYFRLMASMRILRMEIPMNFTMEFFEEQLLTTVSANGFTEAVRVRITVYRSAGGKYLPKTNEVSFIIDCENLLNSRYNLSQEAYEVDLYKDFYVTRHLLSTIKSTNRLINITASIFADENALQNCILVNDAKNVVEAINGNLFLVQKDKIITPPVSEGCVNGVLRKQILKIAKDMEGVEILEQAISPFDLQKADELFISNVIIGVQSITKYRKKEFNNVITMQVLNALNNAIDKL